MDLIDRQEAIDAVFKNDRNTTIKQRLDALPSAQLELSDEEKRLYKKLRSYHNGSYAKLLDKMMASAQPTQTNTPKALETLDCISRQAAIDEIEMLLEQSEDDDSFNYYRK